MSDVSSHTDEWAPAPLDIPPHWEQIDFEDAFESISLTRLKIPQKDYLSSGIIPVVDQGVNLVGGFTNDTSKSVQSTRALIVFGDHTKCFKLVGFRFAPGADGLKVLKPITIDERFAYYACRALRLPDRGYSRHYAFLRKSKLPLAPQNEQVRIVAKIEELFSELDKGIESLRTARVQLNVYRQAVLKYGFEGKLTAQWREENKGTLEKPEQLLTRIKQERVARYEQQLKEWKIDVKTWEEGSKIGKKPPKPRKLHGRHGRRVEAAAGSVKELPDGWYETTFGEVIRNISINEKKLPKIRYSKVGTFPVIDQGKKNVDGYCDDEDRVVSEDLPLIVFGDHTRIFKFLNRPFVPGADGVKVLKALGVIDKWLYYIAHALDFRNKGYARHFQHLKNARLLVPTLLEQCQIVVEIEKKLTILHELDAALYQQLRRADALRQSILKAAFSGQLVTQDPSDEPASVLLDRIKADKEQSKKSDEITKKTKKRKTTA